MKNSAIILPSTDYATAAMAVTRLCERWLWVRPEGGRLTASFGIAERLADRTQHWRQLVEMADQRMYQAKQIGKDCCVGKSRRAGCFAVTMAAISNTCGCPSPTVALVEGVNRKPFKHEFEADLAKVVRFMSSTGG